MVLTAGCAQCHDHKFDPLSQREYFQLFAYFNNVPEKGTGGGKKNVPPLLDLATSDEAARRTALRKEIAALDAKLKPPLDTVEDGENTEAAGLSATERENLEAQRARLQAE